jgi:hypothetical protein
MLLSHDCVIVVRVHFFFHVVECNSRFLDGVVTLLVDGRSCLQRVLLSNRSGHCSPCPHSFAAKLANGLTADWPTAVRTALPKLEDIARDFAGRNFGELILYHLERSDLPATLGVNGTIELFPDKVRRHCHVNRNFADQMAMAATVHAATAAWRQVSIASARNERRVRREIRWRWTLNTL